MLSQPNSETPGSNRVTARGRIGATTHRHSRDGPGAVVLAAPGSGRMPRWKSSLPTVNTRTYHTREEFWRTAGADTRRHRVRRGFGDKTRSGRSAKERRRSRVASRGRRDMQEAFGTILAHYDSPAGGLFAAAEPVPRHPGDLEGSSDGCAGAGLPSCRQTHLRMANAANVSPAWRPLRWRGLTIPRCDGAAKPSASSELGAVQCRRLERVLRGNGPIVTSVSVDVRARILPAWIAIRT